MEGKRRHCFKLSTLFLILYLNCLSSHVEAIRRFREPPPVVKVGNDIVSLTNRKPSSNRASAQTVDIAPLLGISDTKNKQDGSKGPSFSSRNLINNHKRVPNPTNPGVFVLRRRTPFPRYLNGFRQGSSLNQQIRYLPESLSISSDSLVQQNRRSYNTAVHTPLSNSGRLSWMAAQAALQRSRALKSQSLSNSVEGKSEYYKNILPLLYHYKLRRQAQAYANYLRTLHLLSLATSPDPLYSLNSPELAAFAQSFQNSPYSSLLNASFVATNAVKSPTNNNNTDDQKTEASEKSAIVVDEYTSLHREYEKQKRRLLAVFPPPQAEVPFGERTILMVRFPPVPHQKKKEIIKLKSAYDIDGGITFGGPRWMSFGTPFDPYDHPWNKPKWEKKEPPKHTVVAEADKPSSYGVIITQNFVYRPSIGFTNSDPKSLAKHKGDILNGGPSIVAQLAKALAEGNRISNSYYLSKATLHGEKWSSSAKKPPFVIVHLDTYTKKSNDTQPEALGINDQVEANYANGTIIYPTKNNPHILASTKFEFHDGKEIDGIFDKPLATYGSGHGWGWGKVPIHPKGIKEIKNFLKLIFKVHQEAHDAGKKKIVELKKLGDQLERPAFNDSKPLLRNQIADRSTTWLHSSTVGIRSLSEDDDHFPYDKHPLIDVSKDYYYE